MIRPGAFAGFCDRRGLRWGFRSNRACIAVLRRLHKQDLYPEFSKKIVKKSLGYAIIDISISRLFPTRKGTKTMFTTIERENLKGYEGI